MDNLNEMAYIYGSVFILSNRLQILGDKFDENITIKQWLLLVGIFKSESAAPTISEVAGLIGNSRQNAKKMVLRLEKEGFVTLQKDECDARILRITLTKKCKDYFEQREGKEIEFLTQLFDGFDLGTIESFVYAISKLEKNIIEMEKQYAYKRKE